jgi:hypothetical protein
MIGRYFAFVVTAPLLLTGTSAGESLSQSPEEQPPQLVMPQPPRTPLLFRSTSGRNKQSVEVRYVRPGIIKFRINKTGACERDEQGTASVKPYWWLGVETDENESGEAIPVQEYSFKKSSRCIIYIRIDEGEWKQATITEAPECSKGCSVSEQPMHLKGQGQKSVTSKTVRAGNR